MTKKEKDAEKFAKNMVELEQHLGRDLMPDEVMLLALFASVVNASEEDEEGAEDDAFYINGRCNGKVLFFKKVKRLEQHFGRGLRFDESLLLILFDSIKVDGTDEKDEDLFIKKIKELVKRLGRELSLDEAMLIAMFDSIEVDKSSKAMSWEQAEVTLTSSLLSENTLKDLFKSMDECCCDKCNHKEKKMNNNESITGFKELDDALNSIPSDELDKMLKAESEKKKSSSNHEFSDAIAEAALEICGIDLKKKEDQHGHNT